MKRSFTHLANKTIKNIEEVYPVREGPLDIETVSKKTLKESKEILGHNYLQSGKE